jgi:hypothetical protein
MEMSIRELQKMARSLGINTGGLNRVGLVRAIQRTEGNFACFGTAIGACDQINCRFRDDCID